MNITSASGDDHRTLQRRKVMKMLTGAEKWEIVGKPDADCRERPPVEHLISQEDKYFLKFGEVQFAIQTNNWELVKNADVEAACGRPAVECLISQELARGIWLQPIWLTLKNQLNSIALEKTNTPNGWRTTWPKGLGTTYRMGEEQHTKSVRDNTPNGWRTTRERS